MNTTYELGKAFTNARIAKQKFEIILNELPDDRKAKRSIKEWVRLLKRIEMEFKILIGNDAFKKIIQEQLLNDEHCGQIDVIADYMLELPKGIMDQVESYVEGLYNVYKNKS